MSGELVETLREESLRLAGHSLDRGSQEAGLAGGLADEAADRIASLEQRVRVLTEAARPFAECCDQIDDEEDDEEWAKFRLLIKDYRRARAALPSEET